MSGPEQNAAEHVRLITEYQPALYAYILTLHPDRVNAQDILQETNLVLWQKAGELRGGTNFKAWAFRIAYFQTLAQLKRRKRGAWPASRPNSVAVWSGTVFYSAFLPAFSLPCSALPSRCSPHGGRSARQQFFEP